MKKTFAVIALALMSFSLAQQLPALADDDWFDRFDRDHDRHWNYDEFRRAHHDWERHHRDQDRIKDAELRAHWARMDAENRGWVDMDHVRTFHNWY